ncbi:uncharacterized protein EI90DRAFT_3070908 [Cantharellus anzutake]|uniref:uncharacterized protein n=1 Tax=Cantharellus anzutake TaxID=1750568 RepID=UPI0019045B9E|nr:uncharacterized protein EI90DRAFT_3070908 [Cantharellus anzutake]KAF8326193.1 hypothetical protein EI90DRAFT_3070908 [Cantharellus anzutake]
MPELAYQWGWSVHLHMLDFNPYSIRAGSIRARDDTASASKDLSAGNSHTGEETWVPDTDSDDRIEHGADAERWSGNEEPPSSGSIRPPRISKDYRISSRMETRLEPTVLPSRKVTTGLPYREVTSDDTLQGDMFPMIDAERILLFDVSLSYTFI